MLCGKLEDMGRIFVAGSINFDITLHVNRRPKLGETVEGDDVDFALGGKGANQAVSAARLGKPVKMIGRVGEDNFGEMLLDRLSTEDLSLEHVHRAKDSSSGMALVTVDADSENSIIIIPGANATVAPEDVTEVSLGSSDVAVSQFEISQPTIRAFYDHAKDAGATTVLNPAPAEEFHEPILPFVDYLIVNETEALFFSDKDESFLTSEDALVELCADLREHDEQTVIVTLGGKGVFASTPTEEIILEPYPVNPVDTTGAGDAFVGAFATAIADDMALPEALSFANAAGAAATRSIGAVPSLPFRDDIRTIRSKS